MVYVIFCWNNRSFSDSRDFNSQFPSHSAMCHPRKTINQSTRDFLFYYILYIIHIIIILSRPRLFKDGAFCGVHPTTIHLRLSSFDIFRSAPLSQFWEFYKITHTSMISQNDSLHVNVTQRHFVHVIDNTHVSQSY